MTSGKLFRETPFNGYNRDDVLAYMQKTDEEHKATTEELLRNNETLTAQLKESEEKVAQYAGAADRLGTCLTEMEALQTQLQETKERCEALERAAEGQAAAVSKQEALEKELLELRLALQKKEQEAGASGDLQKLLDQTKENLAYKERELKAKEERLAMYEQLWLQHKENYATYIEVSQNADAILADARRQADKLQAEAAEESRKLVERTRSETDRCSDKITENTKSIMTNAVADAQKIVRDAEEKRSLVLRQMQTSSADFRERFDNLRAAVNNILKEIELADMNLLLYAQPDLPKQTDTEGKDVK